MYLLCAYCNANGANAGNIQPDIAESRAQYCRAEAVNKAVNYPGGTMLSKQGFRMVFAMVIAAAATQVAYAQNVAAGYPNKPIRILVPFAPGGGADLLARLVTARMSDKLGQPFVVDNRPA